MKTTTKPNTTNKIVFRHFEGGLATIDPVQLKGLFTTSLPFVNFKIEVSKAPNKKDFQAIGKLDLPDNTPLVVCEHDGLINGFKFPNLVLGDLRKNPLVLKEYMKGESRTTTFLSVQDARVLNNYQDIREEDTPPCCGIFTDENADYDFYVINYMNPEAVGNLPDDTRVLLISLD